MKRCNLGLALALAAMATVAACSSGAKNETSSPQMNAAAKATPPEEEPARGFDPPAANSPRGILPLGDKQWTCGVKLPSQEIELLGKTQADAKRAVREQCESLGAGKACKKIVCRRNY